MAKLLEDPPWWGYSKEHGWVVLDRTIPANKSGLIMDFLFCRCRDSVTFTDKRSNWAAPRYIYASTYLSAMPASEIEEATAEFNRIKALWPEFKAEINKQYLAREEDRLQRERERVLKEGAKRVVKVRR